VHLAETDMVAGRLAEAHLDAVAILAELGFRQHSPASCGEYGLPKTQRRCFAPVVLVTT
jgi:hypothetical protein